MFDTCFVVPGPLEWVSSRIRAVWPAQFMQNAAVIQGGATNEYPEARNYIWVKGSDAEFIKRGTARHWWDLCDPVWWWSPKESRAVADDMAGVIVTCPAMAQDLERDLSIKSKIIPDRMFLPHFDKQRVHSVTDRSEPVRFIWYGASQNRFGLMGAVAPLERLRANGVSLSLTIMDDKPEDAWRLTREFPVSFTRWSLDKEVEVIAAHDIAILPAYPGPWGKLKTNNRALHAWACNVAVSDGMAYDYLYELATNSTFRAQAAQAGRTLVYQDYDARQSAADWENIINAQ